MNYRKFLTLSLTAMMLSACGGGGGGGGGHGTGLIPDPVPGEDPANPGVSKPIVIAHRGTTGYLPEHTLGGYELAIRMQADYIEPDLQFTSDGVLVAMHDDTLDRTTDVADLFALRNGHSNYPVSDFTLAEIKQLTVKPTGTASTSYPGFTPSMDEPFRIPTFAEVLAFAKAQSAKVGRPVGVYPEAKQADPAMEDGILQTLAAHGMPSTDNPVFIQSFSDETISNMHEKQKAQGTRIPQIVLGGAAMQGSVAKLAIIAGGTPKMLDLSEVAQIAAGVGVVIGYPTYPVTRGFIEQAHAAGLRVHGWTFNKPHAVEAQKEYRDYLDIGMDGMFSNYTDLAVLARDQFNVPNDRISSGPLVISHRGTTGYLPEHTLGGYELAIKMRVDYIEPDLQFTSDGVLVAMHDDTLTRTTNVRDIFPGRTSWRVSDFTLDEIKQLTVIPVGTASTSYPGFTPSMPDPFKIPTFDEVIEFAKAQSAKYGRPIGIYPEAKQADPDMEDGILNALHNHGLDAPTSTVPVFIQSFSGNTVRSLHQKQVARGMSLPLIQLGYAIAGDVNNIRLTSGGLDGQTTVSLATIKGFADGLGISISGTNMTKELIDAAHALGFKVHGWTFNQVDAIAAAEEYSKFLEWGMDGMFSNYTNLAVMARDWFMQTP